VWLTTGERGLIGNGDVAGVARGRRRARAADRRQRRRWATGDRPGSDRRVASRAGGGDRAALAGIAAAVRAIRDHGGQRPVGVASVKTDDRDCAALVWLLRQGAGRPAEPDLVAAMLGAVRHRGQLVDARRVLQQRLHDQLNALCPGLSAPPGHGRKLKLESPTGQAVLACAATFAGRPPSKRSLLARAPGRMTDQTAAFWAARWRRLLDPPADAELRAARLQRDLRRWQGLQHDIALADDQLTALLAQTAGQILTTLPGVAVVRAAEFSAYTLPIERWPTPEHLYSAPDWPPRPISPRRSPGADGSAAKGL
jgi:hypothetical protein